MQGKRTEGSAGPGTKEEPAQSHVHSSEKDTENKEKSPGLVGKRRPNGRFRQES